MLMPMMLGMLVTSLVSGRIISRWGRYKFFPIVGTALMTFGLSMLSQLSIASAEWQTSLDALWLGLGMGMVMQVLILAVQNSVDYRHLGAATSGTMLFRSIGGALGVALFGAIFANGLHAQLGPAGMDFLSSAVPAAVQGLPTELHREYVTAVMAALRPVFTVAAATSAIGFALTIFLHEIELRGAVAPEGMAESFAMPRDATSLEELERIVSTLVAHDNRWRLYADLAHRAQLDLSAPELWMLARLGEREPTTLAALGSELGIAQADLAPPAERLCERGIAVICAGGKLTLTEVGKAMRDRALEARRRGLADLLARWQPEQHPDVLALIGNLAQTLAKDLPSPRSEAQRPAH